MNFYWPIEEVYGNLYIGKGAGKHLQQAVKNAKVSVRVCSPYMSSNLLALLLDKGMQGVCIQCITQKVSDSLNLSFSEDKFGLKTIYSKIVKREAHISKDKENKKTMLIKKAYNHKMISIGFLVCSFIYFLINIFDNSFFALEYFWDFFRIFFVLIILSVYFFQQAKKEKLCIETMSTLDYTYTFLQDFCLVAKNQDIPFPHLKLVIVDDSIAFLGSLNLTNSGINHNVESCIKIKNQNNIEALIKCFNDLQECYGQYALSATEIGKYYFETA